MVKSYCVKEKKQTEYVPGSERYVKTKNGRTMMKCTCASCGITKTKFVKNNKTKSGGFIAPVGNSVFSYEGSYLRELNKQAKRNKSKKGN